MTPFYVDPLVTLLHGDCLDRMAELPDNSVDSVVTDPPYNLNFMGRHWDRNLNHGPWATEAFRVLKPGGHLLAFGGTRTVHRLAAAIEDAGFEIRDMLMWIYASGFPKSLDVGKAMDKAAGAERPVVGHHDIARRNRPDKLAERGDDGLARMAGKGKINPREVAAQVTAPATDLARQWDGWGTALKPAHEPIVMARKPLVGTVAGNVARFGTGALNIGATRIGTEAIESSGWTGMDARRFAHGTRPMNYTDGKTPEPSTHTGRWPSNVLLSDPELFDSPNPEVVGSGAVSVSGAAGKKGSSGFVDGYDGEYDVPYGDSGGYSRFFRVPSHGTIEQGAEGVGEEVRSGPSSAAVELPSLDYPKALIIPKSDRAERERGLAGAPKSHGGSMSGPETRPDRPTNHPLRANTHPTVKPIDLMRHLVRLVTPPGGVCLDPFLGSGTTALAASEEGFRCIGIERELEYLEIAKGRLIATPMGLGLNVELVGKAPTRTRDSNNLSRDQRRKRNDDRWVNQQWAKAPEDDAA